MTIPETIILPRPIYDEVIAHAQEGAPEEVCGIISGAGNRATQLVRGRNEAEDPIMDYWVDGQTLLKQFEFEERGETMIAIYHSHPVSEAYPSATDARNAYYPDATYLICSLQHPQRPVVRAFRMLAHDLQERPGSLQPVRGNPRFLSWQRRDGEDDCYLLAFVEQDGRERWQQVQVVEQAIVVE